MQRYAIKPYFIAAGKALTYDDQRRQMLCSLEDKPFPVFPEELQEHTFFEFGSIEEHFKYRDAVMKAYPHGHFPVFQNFNHMQYRSIRSKIPRALRKCWIPAKDPAPS